MDGFFFYQSVYVVRFFSLWCFIYLLIKNLLCKCTSQILVLKPVESGTPVNYRVLLSAQLLYG